MAVLRPWLPLALIVPLASPLAAEPPAPEGGAGGARVGVKLAGAPERGASAEARARAFLARERAWTGGLDPATELVTRRILSLGDGSGVVFDQVWQGVPVEGRSVWVWVRADGRVAAVRSDASMRPAGPAAPSLGPEQIEALALQRDLPSPDAWGSLGARLVWYAGAPAAHADPPRLAWELHPAPLVPTPTDLYLYLDAHSGALIEREDRAVASHAWAWKVNPVVDGYEPSWVELPFQDPTANQLQGPDVSARACLDLGELVELDSDYGPVWVHVCTPARSAFPDAEKNFPYQPEDVQDWEALTAADPFSEVSAFYHASKAAQWFRDMGVTEASTLPLEVLVNYQDPDGDNLTNMSDPNGTLLRVSNAFFTTGSVVGEKAAHPPRLLFGQGPDADMAYDGDVVYHEFTHAMVAALDGPRRSHFDTYGFNGQGGALNEAYADYFACAMTGDPDFGEYASYDPGEEEQHGWRDLTNTRNCHDDINSSSHNDGQIWSAALWTVRAEQPEEDRRSFDLGVMDGLSAAGAYGDFETTASLTVELVGARLGTKVAGRLEQEFEGRYLYDCYRWRSAEGGPTSLSSKGKNNVTIEGPAPGTLQLSYHATRVGGDLVISGAQRRADSSRLHWGGYDKDPNDFMRVLARAGTPITFEPEGEGWRGEYDIDAPLQRTGEVYEATSNDYIYYEARIPIDRAGLWYVMMASNAPEGGSVFWLEFSEQERVVVEDTQGEAPEASPSPGEEDPAGCHSRGAAPDLSLWPLLLVGVAARRRSCHLWHR